MMKAREWIGVIALLALVVYHPKSTVFALLDSWGARFYGRISYSFYLLHPLTLPFINPLVHRLNSEAPQIPAFVVISVASAVSIILISTLAYVSWRFVELPVIPAKAQTRVRAKELFKPMPVQRSCG